MKCELRFVQSFLAGSIISNLGKFFFSLDVRLSKFGMPSADPYINPAHSFGEFSSSSVTQGTYLTNPPRYLGGVSSLEEPGIANRGSPKVRPQPPLPTYSSEPSLYEKAQEEISR